MHKGDRIRDTMTGSEWTIEKVWATDPGSRLCWHHIRSDRGDVRRDECASRCTT